MLSAKNELRRKGKSEQVKFALLAAGRTIDTRLVKL